MGIIINGQNDTIGPVDNSMSLLGTVSIGGTMTIEDFTNIDSVGLITARNGVNVTAGDVNLTSGNLALASATPMVVASNGSGSLRLGAGGSEKVRITSDGKIGVGVASPQQKLDVVGSAHTVAVFRPDASTTSAYGNASAVNNLINLRMPYGENPASTNHGGARWGIIFQGRNDGTEYGTDTGKSASIYAVSEDFLGYNRQVGLAFYTSDFDANQVERLRIAHDGYIGINDNGPNFHLDVNGNIGIREGQVLTWHDGNGNKAGDVYMDSSDNFVIRNTSSVTQRLRIQSDGKVILGGDANQTANRNLSVVAASGNSNEAQIGLQPTNSSGGYNPEAFISAIADGTYGAHMYFKTRDTSGNRIERFRITSAGNIGIGEGQPDRQLHVKSGVNSNDGVLRVESSNNNIMDMGTDGTGHFLNCVNTDPFRIKFAGTEELRIDSAGRLMLGTTTEGFATYGDKFTIADSGHCGMTIRSGTSSYGTIYFSDGDDGSADEVRGFLDYNHSTNTLQLGTNGSTRLRIDSTGSLYAGGSIVTVEDMHWGHDVYQRPHVFSGQSGGNPADGCLVAASAETNPGATRIGSLVFGCKTSSASGVSNSGLKAYIDCHTNTNVSDAWKTGAFINFATRADNGGLAERLRITSSGALNVANPSNTVAAGLLNVPNGSRLSSGVTPRGTYATANGGIVDMARYEMISMCITAFPAYNNAICAINGAPLYINNARDTWDRYYSLPNYLLGTLTHDCINNTSFTVTLACTMTVFLGRSNGWNTVPLTGWNLIESNTYIGPFGNATRLYVKTLAAGTHTLDNDSAMYFFSL